MGQAQNHLDQWGEGIAKDFMDYVRSRLGMWLLVNPCRVRAISQITLSLGLSTVLFVTEAMWGQDDCKHVNMDVINCLSKYLKGIQLWAVPSPKMGTSLGNFLG